MEKNCSNNKFIVIEGMDGAGKDTQAELLNNYLNNQNQPSKLGFAPTKTMTGKWTRELLSEKLDISEDYQDTMIGLVMNADRIWQTFNNTDGIKKVLEDKHYISVRYHYSAEVFNPSYLKFLNNVLIEPDYMFFIDLDPTISLERISSRGERKEVYETKSRLEKARQDYKSTIESSKQFSTTKIFILDGSKSIEEIHQEIISKLAFIKEN